MDFSPLAAAISGRILTNADDMARFLTDWRGKWTGRSLAVVQPRSTADVAAIVRWCRAERVAIVAQGGNTGLAGGATPDRSGRSIVLSTTLMNRVCKVDPINDTLEVEAGATLQQVQAAAQAAGRLFPLSLAAEGSCTIGGNLATNAGGVQVLRYGNARELCLGLEVVTSEGEIWDGLRALRKDNTGYDLRDLFIGSEGTLGIITAAVLKLYPSPAVQLATLVAVPTPQAALNLMQGARRAMGADLTACELMSDFSLQLVEAHVPTASLPLADRSAWYVLLELSSQRNEAQARAALVDFLEEALASGIASDAVLSESIAQFNALWALREDISEAQAAAGSTIKHDISLPASRLAEFVEAAAVAMVAAYPSLRLVVFGHLGDGNLHYNVSPASAPADQAAFLSLEAPINRLVHDLVVAHGGSISAEHGLGVLRRDEAARYKSPVELRLMQALKAALDPCDLMNPGKFLPP